MKETSDKTLSNLSLDLQTNNDINSSLQINQKNFKLDQNNPPFKGLLYKYTNVVKGWQYRYFVIDEEKGVLEYYVPEEKKKLVQLRGYINLAGALISPSEDDNQTFNVNAASGEIYKLKASDAKQRQVWVNKLRQAVYSQDQKENVLIANYSHLVNAKESLMTTQKAQNKLVSAIESSTFNDKELLNLKSTSYSCVIALENCFSILLSRKTL